MRRKPKMHNEDVFDHDIMANDTEEYYDERSCPEGGSY